MQWLKYLTIPGAAFTVLALGQYLGALARSHAALTSVVTVAVHSACNGIVPLP